MLRKLILTAFVVSSKALHEKLKEQLKGVDGVQSKEVPLFWCGMAEVSVPLFYIYIFC